MASLQAKNCRGHKYWYIVESRRVNGKPRPVVLEYLGKADDLLRRLQAQPQTFRIKSYSHGAAAALLQIASQLQIPELINRYVSSSRTSRPAKPLRHHLTVGITLLLGAIGRVCMPTSKRGWWNWAKTTSCEYLLRCSLHPMDSQHFWDLMDALPVESIPALERELLQRVGALYPLSTETLFYDTSNFFTYIATTNSRCTLAQRGNNKQKRHDLRQVGLALVVTREDYLPLFHCTYEGNRHDCKVFQRVGNSIKERLLELGLDGEKHTVVFDRGNNSKKNLEMVQQLHLHYVGALTPSHHQALVHQAMEHLETVPVAGEPYQVYREQREIWGHPRTVLVVVSERLKVGQLRGIYQTLERKTRQLTQMQKGLARRNADHLNPADLKARIKQIVKGQHLHHVIDWSLRKSKGKYRLKFSINQEVLKQVEEHLGFRILMTDRQDWSTAEIIKTYQGQAYIEMAFKHLKNPFHLALKPQFHWTDQKIRVHYLMGILGYLLAALLWKQARQQGNYTGSLDTLLDTLNNIRLTAVIEQTAKKGRPKVQYQLEEMSSEEKEIMEILNIQSAHLNRPKFQGVSVYTSNPT